MNAPSRPGVRLTDLVAELGGELRGPQSSSLSVTGIAPLDAAAVDQISFLSNPKYASQLADSAAGCVIVTPAQAESCADRPALIVTPEPYLYFARLTQWWVRHMRPRREPRVHPSAVVDATARLGQGVDIGPLAVIEAGVVLADGVSVGAQSFVGEGTHIGAGSHIAAQVNIAHGVHIGERCIVHGGAVIGADGFGFAPVKGQWEKIEQLGGVRIGNDVEIGANTCIDRGALGDTILEDGVKLDNLIQIAHNVRIGRHTAMAANTGVAGSANIGAHCMIGGASNINGHITIVDRVVISATTLVTRSIHKPGQYAGAFPFDETSSWEKNAAVVRNLHQLRSRVRQLEKQLSSPDDGHPQDS